MHQTKPVSQKDPLDLEYKSELSRHNLEPKVGAKMHSIYVGEVMDRFRLHSACTLHKAAAYCRKEVIRDSARKEFDARSTETNPETVRPIIL